MENFDAIVIGSGFGGLGAAIGLAESGAKVALLEALNYPGGCASTFSREGYAFESGATLFSGFGEDQLMRHWIDKYELPVELDWLDPMIELRTPDWAIEISSKRGKMIENLGAFPGAPKVKLTRFFERQEKIADTLWALFDDPDLLPPISAKSLLRHLGRSPKYLPLLGLMGRSLKEVVRQEGLEEFEPLRVYLDALCQITVQVASHEAEAPFALAATDYCFRGTAHIRGGVGVLAHALCDVVRQLGGSVQFATRAKSLRKEENHWVVDARNGMLKAPVVIANVLPQNLKQMLQGASAATSKLLDAAAKKVESGWGAAMLYLGIDQDAVSTASAHHFELIAEPQRPFIAGNHIFCSVSDRRETHRAPPGQRTVTVSTHVPMCELRTLDNDQQEQYVQSIQDRMRETLALLAPELNAGIEFQMSASPRTFERFTRRAHGYVGGVPRRVGLHNYQGMFPGSLAPGLFMVGDSSFPGQSTLATAIGGLRTAEAALS